MKAYPVCELEGVIICLQFEANNKQGVRENMQGEDSVLALQGNTFTFSTTTDNNMAQTCRTRGGGMSPLFQFKVVLMHIYA